MTKILYWNIENFSLNKINNPGNPIPAFHKLMHLLSNLMVNTPDIFVVVEVASGGAGVNTPIQGIGANGAMELLAQIRANVPGGANWYLVPPLVSGTGGFAEGIAVYYNNATVNFTGPNVFTGVVSVSPPIPGGGMPAVYPAPWTGYVPVGGGPAINALPAAANMLAGKTKFHLPAPAGAAAGVTGPLINFPNLNNRSPFLTTFTEVGGAMRNINLIAFHSSPAAAALGSAAIAFTDELITPLIGNEVQVLVGDFNVPLGHVMAPAAYNPIGAVGFDQQFTLAAAPAPTHVITHLRFAFTASAVGMYPDYNYMTPMASIDNIFVRYGLPAATAIPIAGLAGAVGVAGVVPPVPGVVAGIAGGVGVAGTTVAVAIAAAEEAGPVNPMTSANVISALSALPTIAPLTIPPANVINAYNAIVDFGLLGLIPGAVTGAITGGGPIALPMVATVAMLAATVRAGAEVTALANDVALAIGGAGLGGTPIAMGTPVAGAATAAAAAAVAANGAPAAAAAAIGLGPNTTAANAATLARAAAGTGLAGIIPAANVAQMIAMMGAVGPAAPGGVPMNQMVVNRVTGAPYGMAGPPVALTYPSTLAAPALLGMGGGGPTAAFRGWANYRAIRRTSDHMALVIDV